MFTGTPWEVDRDLCPRCSTPRYGSSCRFCPQTYYVPQSVLSRPTEEDIEEDYMTGFHFFWKVVAPCAIAVYLMVIIPMYFI